jgi:hypothetical protein
VPQRATFQILFALQADRTQEAALVDAVKA